MPEAKTDAAVQLLDRLVEYFADGAHWMRGNHYDGHERRCLVGAINYLSRKHHLPRAGTVHFLERAIRPHRGLIRFNDHECRSIAELRSVIVKARAFALREAEQEPERQRAAAAVKRWLLAELERERVARAAAGDKRKTYILCPRAPDDTAIAPERLAA
jgi:hypothetical protein